MALSELQDWIMRELAARQGFIDALPVRDDVTTEEMEQAIGALSRRRYVEVVGPPNQNSDLGMDVDEVRLMPFGADYVRTQRR